MTNIKQTKRALLSSVMALLLCFTMLLGTTFAWFTDTASTGVNTIQAGTLDVVLEMKDGDNWVSAEGKTLSFTENYWEPGCTYSLPELRIRNNGNLALKYKVVITGIKGDAKLNEVITWTIGDVAQGIEQKLAAGASSEAFTIKGTMSTKAGNAYQGLKIEGISITVYATQDTVESDSTGNQYDKDAQYNNGANVITEDAILNGTYIALDDNGNKAGDKNAVRVTSGNVTIVGGYYDGTSGGNNAAVRVDTGATVTIKDGYFTVGADASGYGNNVIYADGGNITIEGGTFYTEYSYDGRYFTLNCKDNKGGSITVKGGKFYKFNPAKAGTQGTTSYVGSNEIKVADGYKVVQNGDWYYVMENNTTSVSSIDELNSALTNGGSIALTGDIKMESFLNVSAAATVNLYLNGNQIVRTSGATGIYVAGNTTLNIYGSGDVTAANEGVFVGGNGTVNIYGGNYTSLQAVYACENGTVNIYGGTFRSEDATYGANYLLNQLDSDRTTSNIKVYGGTFINFNPADNAAEGANTNFVATGYTVNVSTSGNDTVYTVVAE